jgi:hypothetical protein
VTRQAHQRPGLGRGLTLGITALLMLSGCGGTAGPDPQGTVIVEPEPEQTAAVDQDLRIVCDAEHIDHEDGVNLMYLAAPGAPLECTVTGLAPDVDATWFAQLFDDDIADEERSTHELEGVLTVAGGEASFTTSIPDEPPLMWLVTEVNQGDRTVYVRGQTHWYWEAPMTCLPDPATEGDTVECRAEGLQPDEQFSWDVMLDDDTGDTVLWLDGSSTTDASGGVVFTFEVPTGKPIVRYSASAYQRYDNAAFDGTIR